MENEEGPHFIMVTVSVTPSARQTLIKSLKFQNCITSKKKLRMKGFTSD